MRLAMVVPPWFEVPPTAYGGIEGMCATLIDGLVARGHDVTVIGAGRSKTSAQTFISIFDQPRNERLARSLHACVYVAHTEIVYAGQVALALDRLDVDLVHDHSLAGPMLAHRRRVPTVLTTHNLEGTELPEYYRALADSVAMVAISRAQRDGTRHLNWAGMVHNGLTVADFPYRAEKDDYVLFLGRMTYEKGPEQAIDAARAAGRRIILAGKSDDPDERVHFDRHIRPRLGPDAEWFGEADAVAKKELLANASCLVMPVQWNEPFGLVMVEAMACGTPVVGLRRGAVPEVVQDGVTGYVCDDESDLPDAIARVGNLDPRACRKHVEAYFDAATMAAGYERVYQELLSVA